MHPGRQGRPRDAHGGGLYAISAKTKVKDDAYKLFSHMLTSENQDYYAQRGTFPSRQSVVKTFNQADPNQPPKSIAVVGENFSKYVRYWPVATTWEESSKAWDSIMQKAVLGEVDRSGGPRRLQAEVRQAAARSTRRWHEVQARSVNFRQREAAEGYLFLLPNIVGVLTFVAFPVVAAIYLSFTDWNLLRGGSFVGLENYQSLLFDDPLFRKVVSNTVLVRRRHGAGLARYRAGAGGRARTRRSAASPSSGSLYFLPVVLFVAVALVWRWLYDPSFGLINTFLGVSASPGRPGSARPRWALPAIVIMTSGARRLLRADLPGRAAGHPGAPPRGGRGRRRERPAAVLARSRCRCSRRRPSSSSSSP